MQFSIFRIRCNLSHKNPTVTLSFEQQPQAVYSFVGNGSSGGGNGSDRGSDGAIQQLVIPFSERLNRIGRQNGGTVDKVVQKINDCAYALKVIYVHHEESVRRQIHREIQILRDLDDPNVVNCHEMCDHNTEIQVLLEYINDSEI